MVVSCLHNTLEVLGSRPSTTKKVNREGDSSRSFLLATGKVTASPWCLTPVHHPIIKLTKISVVSLNAPNGMFGAFPKGPPMVWRSVGLSKEMSEEFHDLNPRHPLKLTLDSCTVGLGASALKQDLRRLIRPLDSA